MNVMTEGTIEVDEGVYLFYRAIGRGSEAVLVPNGLYLEDELRLLAANRRYVFYDLRNRGRSAPITDPARLARGIHQDVDDLEAVRRSLAVEQVDIIGHSYVGVTAVLAAMHYPAAIGRVMIIAPIGPRPSANYHPPLSNNDDTVRAVFARLSALESDRVALAPEQFCEKFWSVLREIYVTDPANAHRIKWSRCDLPNERGFMTYWTGSLLPSLNALSLTQADFGRVTAPVLIIHGTLDRSAPYGGGREWALRLPNARLLSLNGAGHAPWVEYPSKVFDAARSFLDDRVWPANSETVTELDLPHG
jgi:pimeloyl-ACP methyl ester carboxylesterase